MSKRAAAILLGAQIAASRTAPNVVKQDPLAITRQAIVTALRKYPDLTAPVGQFIALRIQEHKDELAKVQDKLSKEPHGAERLRPPVEPPAPHTPPTPPTTPTDAPLQPIE